MPTEGLTSADIVRWSAELDRDAVMAAMEECERLGEEGIYETYGFGSAKKFFIRNPETGNLHSTKAVFGIAFKHAGFGRPLMYDDFSGGDKTHTKPVERLRKLGFEIAKTNTPFRQEEATTAPSGPPPLNQILYGPPGTGKTYATARMAVAICDGPEAGEGDRDTIMDRYEALRKDGRIAFTTFHQSLGYEEFVEGLRPETSGEAGAAFQLVPTPGILRRICAQARVSAPVDSKRFDFDGRDVYKMSIGRAGSEDYIYNEAIVSDRIGIGWGGHVDWSKIAALPRSRIYEAVADRWRQVEPGASGNSGNIAQMWRFLSMRPGDIVIVTNGNLSFRAIGEISGDYVFDSDGLQSASEADEGFYVHQRSVKWLQVLDDPLPVDLIAQKRFSQVSCYKLDKANLKLDALGELITASEAAKANMREPGKPHVLVIDEINRANVSKVFGELITLLEDDKREGAINELRAILPYSGKAFAVPANLHIIGTMNTADRSIQLLDTALRRRFRFVEVMPDPTLVPAVEGIDVGAFLAAMNARIDYLYDRDHRIGHSYFLGLDTKADLDAAMRHKVIPLLQEYFFDDGEKVRAALGDTSGHFIIKTELPAPAGMEGPPKAVFEIADSFPAEAYAASAG